MKQYCRSRRHTLSGKLIILFVAMAIILAVVVGSIIAWSFRTHFEENIRPHLMQYMEYIRADIGSPPSLKNAQALANKLAIEIHYFSAHHQWATHDRALNFDDLDFYRQYKQGNAEYGFGHGYDREFLIARYSDYTLAFSIPRKNKNILRKVVPVLVILLVLIILYYATRRLFAPIDDIKEGIGRIGRGELSYRLNIKRSDELGELGSSINTMADDIENMLEAKRQLLLAISHELRSPLTRAKVAVALLDDAQHRDEIQQDLDEMETLIEELLESERLSTRHRVLNMSTTVLQSLIQQVLTEHFPQNGFTIVMPQQDIVLELDQARIKLLLKNILENAMTHNPQQAKPPVLQVERQEHSVNIVVSDHGAGIEQQHLPHLAEPFYRTDKSRQRKTGGYGLGLYLSRVIAEAHGGELSITSQLGVGTVVRVSLEQTTQNSGCP